MDDLQKLIDNQIAELHKIKAHAGVGFGSDEAIAEIVADSTKNGYELMRSMAEGELCLQGDTNHAYDLKIDELTRQNKILVTALKRVKAGLELTEGRFRNTVETIANRDHLNHINEALKSTEEKV